MPEAESVVGTDVGEAADRNKAADEVRLRAWPLSRALTLLLCSTLTIMAAATITPSLTGIAAAFDNTEHAAFLTRLVLTLPALFIVLSAPLAGWLCDRRGRKPVMVSGLALYVLAGSAGALAPNLYVLLGTRALLGVGIALLMTATTTLIADTVSVTARNRLLGLQGAFMAGGGVVFVMMGGLAAEVHWRVAFGVYLLALLLVPAIRRLPETRPLHAGEKITTPEPGGALLRLAPIYALAVAGMALFYLVPVYMPFLLGERFGASAGWVGAGVAFINLSAMIAGAQFWRLRARMAPPGIVAVTCGFLAAGYAVIGLSDSVLLLVAGMLVAGLGLGLMVPNLSQWIVQRADERQRGRALGWLTMSFFLGQFASPLVAQPALGWTGYGGLYAAAAVVLALAALAAFISARASSSSSARLRQTPPP